VIGERRKPDAALSLIGDAVKAQEDLESPQIRALLWAFSVAAYRLG